MYLDEKLYRLLYFQVAPSGGCTLKIFNSNNFQLRQNLCLMSHREIGKWHIITVGIQNNIEAQIYIV